jgi:hypothetical protein
MMGNMERAKSIDEIADRVTAKPYWKRDATKWQPLRDLFDTDEQFREIWQAVIKQIAAPGANDPGTLDAIVSKIADYARLTKPALTAHGPDLEGALAILLVDDAGRARGDDEETITKRRTDVAVALRPGC